MKILIFGAGGFLGVNLARRLYKEHSLTLVEEKKEYFEMMQDLPDCSYRIASLSYDTDYAKLLGDNELVFLLSRVKEDDLSDLETIHQKLIDACIDKHIRLVFLSSGGTVYGDPLHDPLKEEDPLMPLSVYAEEKVRVEGLLTNSICDHKIIRLANPYGPYQRPNGKTGVIVTLLYKAIHEEPLVIFGDGGSIRDYLYIDDAVDAFINIAFKGKEKIYNVGSGVPTTLKELVSLILPYGNSPVSYKEKRSFDLKGYYLDVSRYEKEFGPLSKISLQEGIAKTYRYLKGLDEV